MHQNKNRRAIAKIFNACLINVYGSVFRFVWSEFYRPIRMLFEENKFIKLLNLSHQLLKQCIENDNY